MSLNSLKTVGLLVIGCVALASAVGLTLIMRRVASVEEAVTAQRAATSDRTAMLNKILHQISEKEGRSRILLQEMESRFVDLDRALQELLKAVKSPNVETAVSGEAVDATSDSAAAPSSAAAPDSRPWPHLESEQMKSFQIELGRELPIVKRVMSQLVDPKAWDWDNFLVEAQKEWGEEAVRGADLEKGKELFDLWQKRCVAAWGVYDARFHEAVAAKIEKGDWILTPNTKEASQQFNEDMGFASAMDGEKLIRFYKESDPELFRLSGVGVYFAHQAVKEMQEFFLRREKP